jgi:hypothetical protein
MFIIVGGSVLVAAPLAKAQVGKPLPPGLSDALQVNSLSGGPVFDFFIPEGTSTGGEEAPLVFAPGNPNPVALGFDPGVAMTNGAEVTLLIDPAGEPINPSEPPPIPIIIPGGGTAFLSDAVVSTLNVPAAFPPQVALFSDPSHFLQEIANDLPNATRPPVIDLETGALQPANVNSAALAQFGLGQVLVASDVEVPEPASLSVLGLLAGGLLIRRRQTA